MIKTLAQELLTEGLLKQDDTVLLGVSGGADSMALLHILQGFNREAGWQLHLHVAHLNHQLRGQEAEADAAFVQAAADGLQIPCTIDERDIVALAEKDSVGIEEVGRRERYAFFERTCLKIDAKTVAVAHHADDNAETILHRILRGTGIRGLGGIARSRSLAPGSEIRVIRPLLRLSRKAILRYLADAGVVYREDQSNQSNDSMRNRIRNSILPEIERQVNPQVSEALNRLGEQAHWVEEYLAETVHRTFETLIVSRTDQILTLNCDALARKSRIVQTEIIRLAYRSFGLGEQDLSFAHLTSALDLIADPASGKQIQLPGGMSIEKRYHQLVVSLPTDEPREDIAAEIAIHFPGKTILPVRRLEINCSIEEVSGDDIPRLRKNTEKLQEYIDLASVHPPLVVRTRRPGDRFFPLGAPGSKKLSDFLTDSKVGPQDRQKVAVLCDQLGPVWVIGHRIDDRVKITALTRRVIHLTARPLEQ